jgi:hypothetical protein
VQAPAEAFGTGAPDPAQGSIPANGLTGSLPSRTSFATDTLIGTELFSVFQLYVLSDYTDTVHALGQV